MASSLWLRFSLGHSALASTCWLKLPRRILPVGTPRLVTSFTAGTAEEFLSRAQPALLRTLQQRAARCVCDLIYRWAVENDEKKIELQIDLQSKKIAQAPLSIAKSRVMWFHRMLEK